MPSTKINPSNIYSVLLRMNSLWAKITQGSVKFNACFLLRITKEKVKFAKGMNKPFQQRYFGLPRLYSACPSQFTELSDMQDHDIIGQF